MEGCSSIQVPFPSTASKPPRELLQPGAEPFATQRCGKEEAAVSSCPITIMAQAGSTVLHGARHSPPGSKQS